MQTIIKIIFATIVCCAWVHIVVGELSDEFLRYAEKRNKEDKAESEDNI